MGRPEDNIKYIMRYKRLISCLLLDDVCRPSRSFSCYEAELSLTDRVRRESVFSSFANGKAICANLRALNLILGGSLAQLRMSSNRRLGCSIRCATNSMRSGLATAQN
jgi:hypothetical protein